MKNLLAMIHFHCILSFLILPEIQFPHLCNSFIGSISTSNHLNFNILYFRPFYLSTFSYLREFIFNLVQGWWSSIFQLKCVIFLLVEWWKETRNGQTVFFAIQIVKFNSFGLQEERLANPAHASNPPYKNNIQLNNYHRVYTKHDQMLHSLHLGEIII